MLIQAAIIAALVALLTRFLVGRTTSRVRAWKKMVFAVFIFGAIAVVMWPDVMNKLANLFGVGRGADFLLYALTVAFIFQELSTYIKNKDEQKRYVKLAREIALMNAKASDHNQKIMRSSR